MKATPAVAFFWDKNNITYCFYTIILVKDGKVTPCRIVALTANGIARCVILATINWVFARVRQKTWLFFLNIVK